MIRRPAAARIAAATMLLAILQGCGSSGVTTSTPGTTAASITVTAGDGQQGGPGAAVPVDPMVTVKNAAGLPVTGVTVTFSVDSGGGTLTGAIAVTNASGVATLGGWTLGPTEGRNVLRIVVAGLAPVFAVATASVPATGQVADVTIGAGGGSITTSTAPLAGLTLTVPAGAFAGSGHWTVTFQPAPAALSSGNYRIVGPLISITTDQGMADQLLTLRIPVPRRSDSISAAFYYDPATGYSEPLPTVAIDANSITVGTRHFSAALLAERANAPGSVRSGLGPFGALRLGGGGLSVYAVLLPLTAPVAQPPVASGFSPGIDDWEFSDHGSFVSVNGQPTGTGLSELYFYLMLKPPLLTGPSLHGKYVKGSFWAGDPGYRIAALAETDVRWPQTAALIRSLPTLPDPDVFRSVLAAMSISQRPVLMAASGTNGTVALVAYQVNATEILAADPNNPGQALHLRYNGVNFLPLSFSGCGGTCTSFYAIALSSLVKFASSQIPVGFAQLPNGPVRPDGFPAYTLQYRDENLAQWKNLTNNTLEVGWTGVTLRAICNSCGPTFTQNGQAGLTALDIYDAGGTLKTSDRSQGIVQFTVPSGNSTIGVHILGGAADPVGGGTAWKYVDFQYIQVSSSAVSISPNPQNGITGAPVTLQANILGTIPAQVRYLWGFGDNTTLLVDNLNTVSHTYQASGVFQASVTVVDIATSVDIGQASSTVQIDQPVPVWRFNTYAATGYSQPAGMNNLSNYGYAYGDGGFDTHFIDLLPATPGSGLLIFQSSAVTSGNTTYPAGLYLQFAGAGYPRTGFDPATAEVRAMIVGGSVGSLTSGTYVGQNIIRIFPAQGLPFSGTPETMWTISATKNGTQISGTITWTEHVWDTSTVNNFFLGDIVRTYTFTATRIK